MDHRIEAMVETEGVSLLYIAHYEVAKTNRTPLYQSAKKVVGRTVSPSAVNEIIHIKVNNIAETQSLRTTPQVEPY